MKTHSMPCNNSVSRGVVRNVADSSALGSSGDSDELVGEYKSVERRRVKKYKRVNGKRVRRQAGRVQTHVESEDGSRQMIKEYLTKLQEIVPFSKKSKRLSKLEVITNAIDYIRELRITLGLPPRHSGGIEEFDRLLLLPDLAKSPEAYSNNHYDDVQDLVTMDVSISSSSDSKASTDISPNSKFQFPNAQCDSERGNQTHLQPNSFWTVDVVHASSSLENSPLSTPMISSSTSAVGDKSIE